MLSQGEGMRKKKGEEQVAPTGGDTRITPAEIQQVEFRLAFRGYNERDVDAFLDRLTADFSSYIDEAQRARGGAPAPATAAVVAGAVEAGSEADAIVAAAREEAARIIREAEAKAAVVASTGAPMGDTRAAVAPFLNKEREFLQGLGTLVQTHAEEVKQMVLTLRARAEAAAAASGPPASDAPAEPATPPTDPAVEAVVAASAAPSEAVAEAEPAEAAPAADEVFAPIRVPEGAGSDDADEGTEELEDATARPAQLRRDSGERSLRELFWGED
jgi:DivIVA domain-containing protein